MRRCFVMSVTMMIVTAGCNAPVEGQLSEEEANRMVVALDNAGIRAQKHKEKGFGEVQTYQVNVPRSAMPSALATLRMDALPRQQEPGIQELFDGKALVSTATEERIRYASALSGELSRSIETIDGVLDARVHVALPPAAMLDAGEAALSPQASVLVTVRQGGVTFKDADIQRLVAGAVHGLSQERVSVVRLLAPQTKRAHVPLAYIGPIAVSQSSAPLLRVALGAMLGLNLLWMVVIVGLVRRNARLAQDRAGSDNRA